MNAFIFFVGLTLGIIVGHIVTTIDHDIYAYGQFNTTNLPGTTYTQQDIANGNGPRNLQSIPILSGSMLPLYEIGEYVTLDYDYPYESLVIGDVVAFIPNESVNCDRGLMCDLVMHRIVDLNDMELTFTTQGDNNDKSMELEQDISKSQYVGLIVETESFTDG